MAHGPFDSPPVFTTLLSVDRLRATSAGTAAGMATPFSHSCGSTVRRPRSAGRGPAPIKGRADSICRSRASESRTTRPLAFALHAHYAGSAVNCAVRHPIWPVRYDDARSTVRAPTMGQNCSLSVWRRDQHSQSRQPERIGVGVGAASDVYGKPGVMMLKPYWAK
jgi:hypothetical protein